MARRRRDAQKTRTAILEAARHLFAQRGISAVSIRDIAKAAGVSHGLVRQYFGNRKQMVAAIIQNEIEDVASRAVPVRTGGVEQTLEGLRAVLKAGRARFHDYSMLITRAQLTGVDPEKMLDPAIPTPATALADAIRELQAHAPRDCEKMDPSLVSAYVNAALFAFETMSPWLMTAVGLKPEDYVARFDEIVDITVKLIGLAIGTDRTKPE